MERENRLTKRYLGYEKIKREKVTQEVKSKECSKTKEQKWSREKFA